MVTSSSPMRVERSPNAGLANRRVECSKLSSAAVATRPNGVGCSGLPGMLSSPSAELANMRIGSSEARCHSWYWYSIPTPSRLSRLEPTYSILG